MTDQYEDFKQFILAADQRSLVRQLNIDIKTPLTSAQNIVNMLVMMQSPSPAIQQKIDSGEMNPAEMLEQLTGLINQVFDVLDFYRATLDEE
jgi:signal transduction histidine kinase